MNCKTCFAIHIVIPLHSYIPLKFYKTHRPSNLTFVSSPIPRQTYGVIMRPLQTRLPLYYPGMEVMLYSHVTSFLKTEAGICNSCTTITQITSLCTMSFSFHMVLQVGHTVFCSSSTPNRIPQPLIQFNARPRKTFLRYNIIPSDCKFITMSFQPYTAADIFFSNIFAMFRFLQIKVDYAG